MRKTPKLGDHLAAHILARVRRSNSLRTGWTLVLYNAAKGHIGYLN